VKKKKTLETLPIVSHGYSHSLGLKKRQRLHRIWTTPQYNEWVGHNVLFFS